MTEIPITTDQIQMFIYLGFYAVTGYIIVHLINLVIAKVEKTKEEVTDSFIIKIKNWFKKRKDRKVYD